MKKKIVKRKKRVVKHKGGRAFSNKSKYSKVEKLVFYDNGFGNSEFVPHLIQNAYFFVENVKTEFPWEYEILLGIKERAKVDTCACDSFKESGMGQKINGQEKIK